ncbi:hypothetical protein RRG08_029579 [Elysia crispata]|uniref:Uncharacterized protein n=1 Tax=Elysia crispata TaxID=231223 RepID=A0AAE1CJX6_9GAST|nr:hypothetical protein RRG08_029579 [Elysia crispata]
MSCSQASSKGILEKLLAIAFHYIWDTGSEIFHYILEAYTMWVPLVGMVILTLCWAWVNVRLKYSNYVDNLSFFPRRAIS